jgi:hypothetical protein
VWGNQNVFCIIGLLKSQLNILPTYDTYGVVHTDTHEDLNILNIHYDRGESLDEEEEEDEECEI